MIADILTKNLGKCPPQKFCDKIWLINSVPIEGVCCVTAELKTKWIRNCQLSLHWKKISNKSKPYPNPESRLKANNQLIPVLSSHAQLSSEERTGKHPYK
jgi:hypothetical protein